MAGNSYNGFTSEQRARAFRWFKQECAAGRCRSYVSCDACGQTKGVHAHSEDYSAPYGDHIGQYAVCFRCHMMIHCRFKNPEAWETYKQHLREGRTFAVPPNFYTFCAETLRRRGRGVAFTQNPPRECTWLDDLLMPPPAPPEQDLFNSCAPT